MNRVAFLVALLAIAPAAGAAAWIPCEQPGIEAPVPLYREAPAYPPAVRALKSEPHGYFDQAALTIARASRLTPAYRDSLPIEAVARLTLFFDPARATCPGSCSPDRDAPPAFHPEPRVTRTMKGPADATTG